MKIKKIRTAWNEETEEWYFSVVDVVSVLTDSADGRKYWNKLKQRLKEEGNELVTICHQLKLKSPKDGKRYNTDVADIAGIFRIIQSIPSPKAEPFKMWLAEATTTELSKTTNPQTFKENLDVAKSGGEAAGVARKEVERRTGKTVITAKNATELNQIVTDLIEGITEDEK